MQTFLPFPSFARSAEVLDAPRLGKQRVETLQILRALLLPTYGWQRHPAVAMWRGHVDALTAYGVAVADEWTARGFADTVRDQLTEFAPQGLDQEALGAAGRLPAWLGDPALHESHRSRLIDKDPAFYRPVFPGTPEGLDYVWPEPSEPPAERLTSGLWVLRVDEAAPWRALRLIGLPLEGPGGRSGPAWRDQARSFEQELTPGTAVALLGDDDPALLHLAEVEGEEAPAVVGGADHLMRAARFGGGLERAALPVPALLQNPRRLFRIPSP